MKKRMMAAGFAIGSLMVSAFPAAAGTISFAADRNSSGLSWSPTYVGTVQGFNEAGSILLSGITYEAVSLYHFDVSAAADIPPDYIITNVILQLTEEGGHPGGSAAVMSIYRVADACASWGPEDATWAYSTANGSVAWPGGVTIKQIATGNALASVSVSGTETNVTHSWSITGTNAAGLISAWLAGTNGGLLLTAATGVEGADSRTGFYLRNHATAAYHPKLIIGYATPSVPPPVKTMSFSADRNGTGLSWVKNYYAAMLGYADVGSVLSGGITYEAAAVYHFDVSALPKYKAVSSVILQLTEQGGHSGGSDTMMSIHRIADTCASWGPDDSTWTNSTFNGSVAWPGGITIKQIGTGNALAAATISGTETNTTHSWAIIGAPADALITGWLTGTNAGLLLTAAPGMADADSRTGFYLRDHATEAYRPKLIVGYTPPPPAGTIIMVR